MNFGVFDIEAENWLHFRILGYTDGSEYKEFFSIGDFLSYIDKRKYKGWRFYAHNGGKYDDNFLYDELFKRKWKMKFIERSGRMICIHVTTPSTQFTIADSYAALPASLAKLSEAFKPTHPKLQHEFIEGEKVNPHDRELRKYLRNDCYCLLEILLKYFNMNFIEEPQYTIASQALNTFKSQFKPGYLTRISLEYEREFREHFYHGGRVEVFKAQGDCNEYDVNSLFPFVMQEAMPTGRLRKVRTFQSDLIGFYCVDVTRTPEWLIPPYLLTRGKKNEYVNGKGRYYLSSAMLNHLRSEYGVRFDVRWGLVFAGREQLFNEYVDFFYNIKRQHMKERDAMFLIAKLFLNALYGKLGATRWRETVETRTKKHLENFSSFNDYYGLILTLSESQSQFILPYLAAYITDLARLHHWKLMQLAPEKMFYCDTDSLFTSLDMSDHVGEKIGELSNKGKWNAIFLAPKTYAKHPVRYSIKHTKHDVVCFKGFDSKHFTFRMFQDALTTGAPLQSNEARILTFRECIDKTVVARDGITVRKLRARKKGIIDQAGDFLKRVKSIRKVKHPYDQRIVKRSKKWGFITLPKRFSA